MARPALLETVRAFVAPATVKATIARAIKILDDVYALVRDHEPRSRPATPTTDAPTDADLVEARLMASHWQNRAEAAEAQLASLEARLSRAEMAALDLRSRVVCLHGKLATSTATVRYRSLTLALESQTQLAEPAMAQD